VSRERVATATLLAGAATLYIVGLDRSGWGNSFYAAAAQAGARSWKAFSRVPTTLAVQREEAHHPGMAVVRALLLAVVTVLFVITVSLVFARDTGPVEKLVLLAVAVLFALLVPPIRRLGRPVLR
jgi:hypothetical protein